MATCAKVKKVNTKNILELKKSDVKEFVKEVLEQDGFPTYGWIRYVYYKKGYLYVTDEINKNLHWCFWDDEFIIFIIKSLLDYESTVCMPLKKHGLSWTSTAQDWINAYVNDSFEDWRIDDWI